MDGAFTSESLKRSFGFFLFSKRQYLGEAEVLKTKTYVVENVEQHPQITF